MKDTQKYVGTLTYLKRLDLSKNGNPRFEGRIESQNSRGKYFRTVVDSSYGYMIDSLHNKRVQAIIGTHYGKPQLASIELA